MHNTKSKILVIDDDVDLLMLLERRLDKEGYWTETAVSIPEGWELIRNWRPDLILLDININGEDGRKLSWELKTNPDYNKTTVILISGFDTSYRRALLFHADAILPKPLDTPGLLYTLSHYLNRPVRKQSDAA